MAPLSENKKKRLIHLMLRGNLNNVIKEYEEYPESRKLRIPNTRDTALHVAVSYEWDIYMERMVDVAESGVLELRNEQGDTALHVAAKFGYTYICKCIADKDVALIRAQNKFGETPLFSAVSSGKTKAFLYLYQLSKNKAPESLDLKVSYTRSNGDTILHTAITDEFFDLAYIIIDKYPILVHQKNRDGLSPLHLLATKPSVFRSGVQAFGIRKLIYHCVLVRKLSKRDLAKAPNPTLRWAAWLRVLKGFSYCGMVVRVLEEVIDIWSSWWKSKFIREEQRDGEAANKQVDRNNQQDEETTNNQGYVEIDEEDAEAANEQAVHKENLRQDETATDKEDSAKVDNREVILWVLLVVLLTLPIYVVFFLCFSCPYKLLKITFMLAKTIFGYEEYARLKHIKETCVWSEEVMNKLIKSEHAYKQSRREATIEIVENPIYAAAKNGISEMVLRILDDHPETVYEKNVDQKNILMLAVEYRRHRLYDELISKVRINKTIFEEVDKDGNNLLHIAAYLQPGKKFWSIRGAALHLHMEIKWYEFIKKSMPPRFFTRHNTAKQTPKKIFKESHKDLTKEGRQWLTNTSQSCSLVAALIATVAFATSATIPGGLKQDNGVPSLEHKPIFIISASASLVALSSSMISVVMFLAILTSSFQLKDFRKDLPYKLLLGLISLLVSIVSMIISFFAGHHFVLRQEFNHDAALVYELLCSFMVVYIVLKFPLDFEIVWSTLRTNPPK